MGHYASEMGYGRDDPDYLEVQGFVHQDNKYRMYVHTECRQMFMLTYDEYTNNETIRMHVTACPAGKESND